MIELLNNLDNDLFLMLHSAFRNPFLDHFMMMFSGKWIWVPFYVTLAWMILYNRRNLSGLMMIMAVGLAIALTDQTCATLIRPFVGRLRPSNPGNPISTLVQIVDGYRGGNYGFPSCHAGNSMALAVFMLLAARKRTFTFIILGWAIINSLSRIYLGVHYPGDLLVGWSVGTAIGFGCYAAWYYGMPLLSRYLPAAASGNPAPPMRGILVPGITAGATVVFITVAALMA